MIAVDAITDDGWHELDESDAVVFGCPTYMGNVSAGFQAFAEKTGRRCINGTWQNKIAAGFTNSGAKSGDKLQTLMSLAVFAAQHHMLWVSLGLPPGWNSSSGSDQDLNRLGFWPPQPPTSTPAPSMFSPPMSRRAGISVRGSAPSADS